MTTTSPLPPAHPTRLETAYAGIDAANSKDPNTLRVGNERSPAELVYGQRMSAVLESLYPDASEALKVAARAQHIRRWEIPRATYPMDRPGYLRWRSDLKDKHAEWTAEILVGCGYREDEITRIASLIRKERLKEDADAQALEDTAAIVFLIYYALDFAPKHTPEKVRSILAKTFAKMSAYGRKQALDLDLPAPLKDLVQTLASPRARQRASTGRRVAAILASHGDRAGEAPNANLIAQAEAVRELLGLECVAAGVLKGEPSIEAALHHVATAGAEEVLVYPLFMADGYFVRTVLPARLDAAGFKGTIRILPPLGHDSRMPALVLESAIATAAAASFDPEDTRLLIVGHGSKIGPASKDTTLRLAATMAEMSPFRELATAFLEEDPLVHIAIASTTGPTVVAGFFFGDGMHAAEDVPAAIAAARGSSTAYTGAIGSSPALPQLVAEALKAAIAEMQGASTG